MFDEKSEDTKIYPEKSKYAHQRLHRYQGKYLISR